MTISAKPLFCTLFAVLVSAPLAAAEHQVKMLNKGEAGTMVFEPGFIKAAPGDTIRFISTDPGHNAQTIPGMLPEGEAAQKGPMGKDYVMTVASPGLYGIKCQPHTSMGMVALVKVGTGTPANLEAASAVKLPPLARKRMSVWLADAK